MEISPFDLLSLMLDHDCVIGNLPFCWYASRLPIPIVKKMVSTKISTQSYGGKSPLQFVMDHKLSREVAELLVDANCDMTGCLELSIRHGRSDISCLLLERGVDPRGLVLAIKYRSMKTVKMLLKKKCDLNDGWPIHFCIETGAHEMGRAIIKAGGDVDQIRKTDDLSPLMLAVKCKAMFLFSDILKKCDVDLKNGDGHSALYFAARDGVHVMVRMMVKHGAKKLNLAAFIACFWLKCLKEMIHSPFST